MNIIIIDIIIWLVAGGLIGGVASVLMQTNGRQEIVLNVLVGIVGAVATGWLLSGLFETAPIAHGSFSLPGLLTSLLGASILLPLAKIARTVLG